MVWACVAKFLEDTEWVMKCMEYEVEGSRSRGRPEDLDRGCAKRLSST